LTSSKRRPVLALTAPDQQGDFLACPITSRAGWTNSRCLLPDDLADGALPLASWVRTDKVVTLHTALIVRRLGRVAEHFRAAIAGDVCRFLDTPAGGSPT
jgi:mRNA-degrading endonuclease toxin of MazEF toxin-antitoxin module